MSFALMTLQPRPWLLGYSQSKSMAGSSYCLANWGGVQNSVKLQWKGSRPRTSTTVFTYAVRFSGVATAEEKKREPAQPPMLTAGVTFCME